MIDDIATVIWKEWKEVVVHRTRSRSEAGKTVAVLLIILGIVVWRSAFFVNNLGVLIVPSLFLLQLLGAVMAESVAGERERHTLETLLASRLSDLSILIGKIAAGVILVCGLVVVVLGLGLAGWALQSSEGPRPAIPWSTFAALVIFYFLLSVLMSCAGVLVSVRASTVRQAMQRLSIGFMVVFLAGIMGFARLTPEWRARFFAWFGGENLLRTEIIGGLILVALNLILFAGARYRFQRARLILD